MLKTFATFMVGSMFAVTAHAAPKTKTEKTEKKVEEKKEEKKVEEKPAEKPAETTTLVAQPAATETKTETKAETTTATSTGGGNWDYNAGGVQEGTWTLHLDLRNGISPQLGFAYAFNNTLEVGASIMATTPTVNAGVAPVTLGSFPGFYGELPIRLSLMNDGAHSFALKLSPGLSIYRLGTGGLLGQYSFLIGVRASYGYWAIAKTLQLGVALDLPMVLLFSPTVQFFTTITAGPHVEYNFTEHFGLYGEARLGMFVDTNRQWAWAQTILFGLAAHL